MLAQTDESRADLIVRRLNADLRIYDISISSQVVPGEGNKQVVVYGPEPMFDDIATMMGGAGLGGTLFYCSNNRGAASLLQNARPDLLVYHPLVRSMIPQITLKNAPTPPFLEAMLLNYGVSAPVPVEVIEEERDKFRKQLIAAMK